MQDNMKRNNIHVIGILGGEEKEQGIENLFEKVMMKNFPKLMREKLTQIQESRSPIQEDLKEAHCKIHHNSNGKIPRQRILKAAGEKQEVPYKGAPIRLTTDFSMETLHARREWQEIFQVMRTRGLQPRLLYPARLSIKTEGQIKTFQEKEI